MFSLKCLAGSVLHLSIISISVNVNVIISVSVSTSVTVKVSVVLSTPPLGYRTLPPRSVSGTLPGTKQQNSQRRKGLIRTLWTTLTTFENRWKDM
jgi:hypothetical protein